MGPDGMMDAGRYHHSHLDDPSSPGDLPSSSMGSSHDEGPLSRGRLLVLLPVSRVLTAVANWVKGPQPPRIQKIEPLYPRIQTAPVRILNEYLPKWRQKLALLLAFYFAWLLAFVTVLHTSTSATKIEGYGKPQLISCIASYWAPGNGCGLNGNDCRPFHNSTFPFRCPANCQRVMVLNSHAVGAQEIIYKPLVVGGPEESGIGLARNPVYRGDSFLCAAALHAGVITDARGGCGVATLLGQKDDFRSTLRNGIQSFGFDSSFPLSFSFLSGLKSECKDLRWPLLVVSVVFTSLLSIFTTSPAIFFGSIFPGIFFHVGLASDPPNLPTYRSIISVIVGRFVPAAFVAFVLYRYCIRPQLRGLTAQYEKTVLWLGGCWVGALTNYTFDFIPIQRLTPHDLDQQPGAKAALAIIIVIVLLIVLGQIWYLRLEGRLPKYLALYFLFGVTLGLLVAIPGLNLRIHHYVLALLLLPGAAIQTRPALLYQGILIGLFINGIARWGFDSILQTPAQLRGDGKYNSPRPVVPLPAIQSSNITFSWGTPPSPYDGLSILVNDVERFRGYEGDDPNEFSWERPVNGTLPYYFRFGYMQGSDPADYTRAGIWEGDGRWTPMQDGPSKRGL